MNVTEAVILAGGVGSRFKPYTEIIPKPMIPVSNEEKPVLQIILSWLKKNGFNTITILCGYKWKYIYNYVGKGGRFGVKVKYSVDDEEYSGSGGALLKAIKNNIIESPKPVIWYGDIIALVNPSQLLETHVKENADATVVVTKRYRVPVGVAEMNTEGSIISLAEKPWLKINVTIGVLVINKKPILKAEEDLGKKFDIMSDLVPWMIKKGYRVKGQVYNGYWIDVGSLEKYVKLDEKEIMKMMRE